MTKIEIYTSPFCDYCHRAKSLLSQKKAVFTEIDVTTSKTLMDEMVARTGGLQTVPQIFIGEYHVAGCDDVTTRIRLVDRLLTQHFDGLIV